jgi:hypothetical protein
MNWLIAYGVRRLFSGSRLGQPWMAGLGAALALIGWLRDRREPPQQLIYRKVLRDGEAIRVGVSHDAADDDDDDDDQRARR